MLIASLVSEIQCMHVFIIQELIRSYQILYKLLLGRFEILSIKIKINFIIESIVSRFQFGIFSQWIAVISSELVFSCTLADPGILQFRIPRRKMINICIMIVLFFILI